MCTAISSHLHGQMTDASRVNYVSINELLMNVRTQRSIDENLRSSTWILILVILAETIPANTWGGGNVSSHYYHFNAD